MAGLCVCAASAALNAIACVPLALDADADADVDADGVTGDDGTRESRVPLAIVIDDVGVHVSDADDVETTRRGGDCDAEPDCDADDDGLGDPDGVVDSDTGVSVADGVSDGDPDCDALVDAVDVDVDVSVADVVPDGATAASAYRRASVDAKYTVPSAPMAGDAAIPAPVV